MARAEPDHDVAAHGFVVDIVSLLRRPGNRMVVVLDEPLQGVAISAAAADRVSGELVAESMSDSLTLSGRLHAQYTGDCRRCLDPASGSVEVDVHEIFERAPVEGETYPLPTDRLDLEPVIREMVLLSLPLAPLCSDNCLGPSPEAFPAEIESDEDAPPAPDPRWAALDQLNFD